MKMRSLSFRLMLALGTAVAAWPLFAQKADKPYVMTAQGPVRGDKLVASPAGDLTLTLAGGASQSFKAGSYKGAWIPKPKEIGDLETAYAKGQVDQVLQQGPAVFNAYRFLGWGGKASYLEGMAQYDKRQYASALQLFDRGLALKDESAPDDLIKGKVLALMALNKKADASGLVDRLILAKDDSTAAFAFNVRGRLLQEEKRNKDAVLQYLKTLLIFKPDGSARKERTEAKTALVALLKELGDARAAEFANMP